MSKHVAVLMGGWSAEREVSLVSGKACAKALRERGYRVTEIDVDRDLAPPRASPRQPAASISSQALAPGGFLKVLPPVRVRIGWLSPRASAISSMRAAIAASLSGRAVNTASVNIQSSGAEQWR